MFLMSKTGFSSAYDEGKGAYMHPVFFFLFQEIFNFHISSASNSFELLSEIKQILALCWLLQLWWKRTAREWLYFWMPSPTSWLSFKGSLAKSRKSHRPLEMENTLVGYECPKTEKKKKWTRPKSDISTRSPKVKCILTSALMRSSFSIALNIFICWLKNLINAVWSTSFEQDFVHYSYTIFFIVLLILVLFRVIQ